MYKSLRNAFKKAEDKQNEADMALQSIAKYLTFHKFSEGDEPKLSMCSGNEVILEWHGSELDRNQIIDYMENVGYITPEDFKGV